MMRKFVLTSTAVAVLMTLTNVILAGANDYVFEPVKTDIKSSNVATIAVRLLHKPSERPVTDAVIVQMRIAWRTMEGPKWTRRSFRWPARNLACTPSWRLSR
jgi:hypothetical protein